MAEPAEDSLGISAVRAAIPGVRGAAGMLFPVPAPAHLPEVAGSGLQTGHPDVFDAALIQLKGHTSVEQPHSQHQEWCAVLSHRPRLVGWPQDRQLSLAELGGMNACPHTEAWRSTISRDRPGVWTEHSSTYLKHQRADRRGWGVEGMMASILP